jgi:hypothetical protein
MAVTVKNAMTLRRVEECTAYIIRVIRIGELGKTLAVTSN